MPMSSLYQSWSEMVPSIDWAHLFHSSVLLSK